jgi:hypothetical protein
MQLVRGYDPCITLARGSSMPGSNWAASLVEMMSNSVDAPVLSTLNGPQVGISGWVTGRHVVLATLSNAGGKSDDLARGHR